MPSVVASAAGISTTPAPAVTPLQISEQPSMTDLVDPSAAPVPPIVLDPNTPRSPKHQAAEHQFTTGGTAQCLTRHMDAVVKVLAVHSKPNFELPWQRRQQHSSKSTGFAVATDSGDRWLLTNAHSVAYATQVQVKRRGDDEKYAADVLSVGTECDVALLTVKDDAFWQDIVPLQLGGLPQLQESVAVMGYPIGGDSLAISAGVVSRVQMTHYSHGCMSLLALQTDAAINSGNSGGPVMSADGRCCGIAFQSLTGDTQSVGYVIPTTVVCHFLQDVIMHARDGLPNYTGFPSLNIVWQEMDSKALKRAYGLAPHQKGVLVRSVAPASNEAAVIKPDDVLVRVDGVEIGSDGSVPFRRGERVDFKFVVTKRFIGDKAKLDLIRQGKEMAVEVELKAYQYLVPPHLSNGKPSYFMVGGLVFTACTDPYLVQRYGSLSASPVRLMHKTWFGVKNEPDQQVVVLSNVLACAATAGYEATLGLKDSAVTAFNGTPIRNLAHLARLVSQNTEPFLKFELEASNKVVVLDAATATSCTDLILEEHSISSKMSKDIEFILKQEESMEAPTEAEGVATPEPRRRVSAEPVMVAAA